MPGFVLFVLLVVAIAVYLSWAYTKKQQAAWASFAEEEGLRFTGGSLFSSPSMAGTFCGLAVRVEVEYRGSGNSRTAYTRVVAQFRRPLPPGLKIARQGLGESIKIFMGAEDIVVGIPSVDPLLRIQAEDPEAARTWVRRRGVDRHLRRFIAEHDEAILTQGTAVLVVRGFVTDPRQLREALAQVAAFVIGVEEGEPWRPGEEQAFLPKPKLKGWVSPSRSASPSWGAGRGSPAEAPAEVPVGSAADALVSALAAGGRTESEGRFTLNRERAKERMRDLRLARPELYVVSFLQAAQCKGARRAEVTVDSDELLLWFDGSPFTLGDFEELYGSAFADRRDRDARARQHLALGVSAAVGQDPRFVEVRSGDGQVAARLRLEPGAPDALEPLCEPLPSRTEIRVKLRLADRLGGKNDQVEAALRQAGCYAKLDLRVNGESVSFRFRPAGVHGLVPISWEGFEGFCAFDPAVTDRAELRRLLDGAWMSTEVLQMGLPGFCAVVESERFRTDLSAGTLVQNEAWEESLAAVAEAERRSLLALGAEIERKRRLSDPQGWAMRTLRAAHLRYPRWEDFAPQGEAHDLAQLAVWPVVLGGPCSLWALMLACDREGRLPFSHVTLADLGMRGAPAALSFEPTRALEVGWLEGAERAFIAHLFGERLWSGVEELLGSR